MGRVKHTQASNSKTAYANDTRIYGNTKILSPPFQDLSRSCDPTWIDQLSNGFLSVVGPVSYTVSVTLFRSKIAKFSHSRILTIPAEGVLRSVVYRRSESKN